jgi:hypothetical protein
MYKVYYKIITGKDTGMTFSGIVKHEPVIGTVTKMKCGNFETTYYEKLR